MTRPPLFLAALAALMGAAGVALAAAAVHSGGGELALRGAEFLILHAAAALGIAAHARVAAPSRGLVAVGFAMVGGATLFAADLAFHAFAGVRLFPYAAPIGGTTMLLSWIALAIVFATQRSAGEDRDAKPKPAASNPTPCQPSTRSSPLPI